MHSFDFGTVELRMLWASAALGLIQLVLYILFSLGARPFSWAVGPRDVPGTELNKMGARVERAWKNFYETFPIFAVAVLMTSVLGKHSAMTALGAELYFYGRVIYVPVYALGIPVVRTAVWMAAMLGIVLILLGVWPGI